MRLTLFLKGLQSLFAKHKLNVAGRSQGFSLVGLFLKLEEKKLAECKKIYEISDTP